MDRVKAQIWEERLKGTKIGNWEILSLIDNGKSAAVFRATDGSTTVALKLFDDEIIKRFGDTTQLGRIERELSLIGEEHPNMVRILDGGHDKTTGNHFIVMNFLEGPNLKSCLEKIPPEAVPSLIQQLASAAQFLEDRQLCHRDIKPENILLLNDYTHLVLLDFGVLRPIGKPGLTDDDGIQPFIGTLQYASPEFLLRREEDTLEGWRALTFYQIGGVAHDLIMRKSLFAEFTDPYARLVNAVQFEQPQIQNSAAPSYLVELARTCLLKDPKVRERLLSWDSFKPPSTTDKVGTSPKQRVTNRNALARAQIQEVSAPASIDTTAVTAEVLSTVIDYLKDAISTIRSDNSIFPPATVVRHPRDGNNLRVQFRKSPLHGLPYGLTMNIEVEVLDAVARAISLKADAFVGTAASSSTTVPHIVFYEGLYSGSREPLFAAFEAVVYGAIDKAQQVEHSTAPEACCWLTLEVGGQN
jgi:serine/threonine protein kinase